MTSDSVKMSRKIYREIAHLNNDGKTERTTKSSSRFINEIIKNKRTMDDLEIECFQCNWCLSQFDCYPDQLPIELKGVKVNV